MSNQDTSQPQSLLNFLANLKNEQRFIMTVLDGKKIFSLLGDQQEIAGVKDGVTIWNIKKNYDTILI